MAEHPEITVPLPEELVTQGRALVDEGYAASFDALLSDALRRELRRIDNERIDEAFRRLADDPGLLEEEARIMAEFEQADAEAWRIGEEDYLNQTEVR